MATSDEKQELLDDIKRPIRHYRIQLYGYGIEGVWGSSNEDEYNYWKDHTARSKDFNLTSENHDNAFSIYMFEKEEKFELYKNMPPSIQREGEWYDQGDIDHISGPTVDSCHIKITELDGDAHDSKEIDQVLNNELAEFCDMYEIENLWGEVKTENYMFQAISVEKGCFFNGHLTTSGKIDIAKFQFDITECPNGDEIVVNVMYKDSLDDNEGDYIDNWGSETNGKSLYVEIVSL